MKFEIPYNRQLIGVEIPDHLPVETVESRPQPRYQNEELFRQALANPLNSVPLTGFMDSAREFMFIVNDATRPTPTEAVLEAIHPLLKRKDVRFMVATGTHRAPTVDELSHIMGRFYEPFKERILIHDARDARELTEARCMKSGRVVQLNRHVVQAKNLVVINSVEPHYFAGYTGGRKSFIPGVAGYRTIERNHRLAMSPDSASLKLEGNPVHEDMDAAIQCLGNKEIFSIQTVLDLENNLIAVTTGHIRDSFQEAARLARPVFSVKVHHRADIVVAVIQPPKDINFYQAQNSLENAKLALKDGGVLILVSGCREGIGPSAFYDWMSGFETPGQVLKFRESEYKLGYHKAVKMAHTMERAGIWAVTELPPAQLEAVFIRAFASIQRAIDEAIDSLGGRPSIMVIMDSDRIVPVCGG